MTLMALPPLLPPPPPLLQAGVIFCSISEAVREYPELVQKYMGSVVGGSGGRAGGCRGRRGTAAAACTGVLADRWL